MDPTFDTCPSCGEHLPPGSASCGHCGAVLATPTESVTPAAAKMWEKIMGKLQEVAAPKYEVRSLIGYGGMAGVYLAHETRLGRDVAIKVMSPSLMMDEALVNRFEQEARTTAQLSHPNIVTILDVEQSENLHYFAMTYVPGRTLAQVMTSAGARLPLGAVATWITQVASALDYAHRRGVIHRDIKPGNIIMDAEGDAHVTDFGIAKVAKEPSLTRTGMLVGTPSYMSPEQCMSGGVTSVSDQYALGLWPIRC